MNLHLHTLSAISLLLSSLLTAHAAVGADDDLDGVSNEIEAELLEAFAPVWIPNSDSNRPPLPLDWYVAHCELRRYETDPRYWSPKNEHKHPESAPGRLLEGYGDLEMTLPSLIEFPYLQERDTPHEFFRLVFQDISHNFGYARPADGEDPDDPITWECLQTENRGVYGRVYPDYYSDEHYVVQYYLFFGYNRTDTPQNSVGPCTILGTHEGDVVGVEFLVHRPSMAIVNAVYHNHGRRIFVDRPEDLNYHDGRPVVYLERQAQECVPWPGHCGFGDDQPIADSIGIGHDDHKGGFEFAGWRFGAECEDFQVVREHHGLGTPLCVTNVVNLGEVILDVDNRLDVEAIKSSAMSDEAKFIHIFSRRTPEEGTSTPLGRFGTDAYDRICICWGWPIGKSCFAHPTVGKDSPTGPSGQWKMWENRRTNSSHKKQRNEHWPGDPIEITAAELSQEGCTVTLEVTLNRAVSGQASQPVGVSTVVFEDDRFESLFDNTPFILFPPGVHKVAKDFSVSSEFYLETVPKSTAMFVEILGGHRSKARNACVTAGKVTFDARPGNVRATQVVSGNNISVQWNPVCGAIGYNLYRRNISEWGAWEQIPDDQPVDASAWPSDNHPLYVDDTAMSCTVYAYQVEAVFESRRGPQSHHAIGFFGLPINDIRLFDDTCSPDVIRGERTLSGEVYLEVAAPSAPTTDTCVDSDSDTVSCLTLSTTHPDVVGLFPAQTSVGSICPCNGSVGTAMPESVNLSYQEGEIVEEFTAHFCCTDELTKVTLHAQNESCDLSKDIWLHPVTQWDFAPAETLSQPFDITGVVVADFDQDGDEDIAHGSINSNTVAILFNDGHGRYLDWDTYAIDYHPETIIVADLNADGWPDLVVSEWGAGRLYTMMNDGTGRSFDTTQIGSPGFGLLEVSDVDQDGDLDISLYVDDFLTYRNDGTGMFTEPLIFAENLHGGVLVSKLADMTGDDVPDLVVGNYDGILYFPNLGFGTFGPPVTLALETDITDESGSLSIIDLEVVDLDANGLNDVAAVAEHRLHGPGNITDNFLVLIRQETNGWATEVDSVYLESVTQVAAADFDQDGDPDIAVLQEEVCGEPGGNGVVALLRTNAPFVFDAPGELVVGSGARDLVATDVDRDGDIDLVAANLHDQSVTILRNTIAIPREPYLRTPSDRAYAVSGAFTFTWSESPGADHYQIDIALDKAFQSIVATSGSVESLWWEAQPGQLDVDRSYFWRVTAHSGFSGTAVSDTGVFTLLGPQIFDCNDNGVDDFVEIADGTADDFNGNALIDDCETSCAGDVSPRHDDGGWGNSVVNIDDVLMILQQFGPCQFCPEDISPPETWGNDVVNIDDLLIALSNFGPC